MKTLKLIFILLFLLVLKSGTSQETWYQHYVWFYNTSPGLSINSVSINNNYLRGFVCADSGYVGSWTGGVEDAWALLPRITTKNLYSIFDKDSAGYGCRAVIVGETGQIIKIKNLNLISITSPTTQNLYSVFFPIYSNGIAVGNNGTVIRTTNGGYSWSIINSGISNTLFSVTFPSTNTAYAAGVNGVVIKTTDNGQNWVTKTQPVNDTLRSVWFTSDNTGFVVSRNGAIFKTTDGGNSWQNKLSGTSQNLNAIRFNNQNIGYIAGNNKLVLRTTNAGETWTTQLIPGSFQQSNYKSIGIDLNMNVDIVGSNKAAIGNFPDATYINPCLIDDLCFIFPNPTHNKITIQLQDAGTTLKGFGTLSRLELTICNLQGQTLLQQNLTQNNTEIDISELEAGIYIACLISKGVKISSRKIVKIE